LFCIDIYVILLYTIITATDKEVIK